MAVGSGVGVGDGVGVGEGVGDGVGVGVGCGVGATVSSTVTSMTGAGAFGSAETFASTGTVCEEHPNAAAQSSIPDTIMMIGNL